MPKELFLGIIPKIFQLKFVKKTQIIYVRIKDLPNKRIALTFDKKYDNYFIKTERDTPVPSATPMMLGHIIPHTNTNDWFSADEMDKTERLLLFNAGYQGIHGTHKRKYWVHNTFIKK